MLDQHELPKCFRGFEHIKRYWSTKRNIPAVKIFPGECYVTLHDEMIVTVLGSCISACIRDKATCIGGMNHFLLPIDNKNLNNTNPSLSYGNWAMEFLINEILKRGGDKNNLEVKIFGGGNVLPISKNIGSLNIAFIKEFLEQEQLKISVSDCGLHCSRKILYFPKTGLVKVRKLEGTISEINKREIDYMQNISKQKPQGDIELF